MASLQSVSEWYDETDVLVCGSGIAGIAAAIESHDLDLQADVLLIEKLPERYAGGNSRVSGQSLLIPKSAAALRDYQRALNAPNPVPEPLLAAWAERMAELEPYIRERAREAGAAYVHGTGWSDMPAVYEFPEFGAAAAVAYTSTILPTPSGVWLAFKSCLDQRPRVRQRYASPLLDLIQDPDTREVFGAVVRIDAEPRCIRARRGVVLCTGGFENDLDMQRNYCGLAEARPLGSPGNTGDGIRVLQRAGAELWHLRNPGQSGGLWPGFRFPGHDTVFMREFLWKSFSWIDIGRDDRRFVDETADWHLNHYKQRVHGEWVDTPHHRVLPIHMLFDETTRLQNRLVTTVMTWNALVEQYPWSSDNGREIERGWITRAATLVALAGAIGRDPSAVAATVDRYNEACRRGVDAEFGRRRETLAPLERPPFYAIEVVPAIVCTGGGARRSVDSEVLDPAGRTIPRLYEAGELGSMFSNLYQTGTYLTEAMITGRAAGAHAVRLPSWSP